MNTVDSIRQDLKYGIRQLRLNPGFTLAAVLSLALGIGANTAIFTLFDQIVLRLLPVHNPRELVQLRVEGGRFGSNSGDGQHTFSHPTYLALRDRNTVFSGLTGQLVQTASLVGEDRSEMIRVGMVAGNFFNVLGVRPHLGRLLTHDDDKARMGHPVAVLQYDFWQTLIPVGRLRVPGGPSRDHRFARRACFVVARRTREIGIRIALGADKVRVIRLIMMEMLPVILFGIATGVITGLLCGRFVENQLFGVKAADPPVFVIGAAVLLTASTLAAFIPAWRASRIDPMDSLRHE